MYFCRIILLAIILLANNAYAKNIFNFDEPLTKIEKRLIKDKIAYKKEFITYSEQNYSVIYINPEENSKNVLQNEANRLFKKYNGLRLGYSNRFLNKQGAGGLYIAELNSIFVNSSTILNDMLDDDIYKHELLHAQFQIDTSKGLQNPLMARVSQKDVNKPVCSMKSDLEGGVNFYINEGYYFEEIPAYLISIKYILKNDLKKSQSEISSSSYYSYILKYLSETVECANRITSLNLNRIQNQNYLFNLVVPNESDISIYEVSISNIRNENVLDINAQSSTLYLLYGKNLLLNNDYKKMYFNQLLKLDKNLKKLNLFANNLKKINPYGDKKNQSVRIRTVISKIDTLIKEIAPTYTEK